jgi:hypothetical protein
MKFWRSKEIEEYLDKNEVEVTNHSRGNIQQFGMFKDKDPTTFSTSDQKRHSLDCKRRNPNKKGCGNCDGLICNPEEEYD